MAVELISAVRPIGTARHKDKKPGIQWAGLFGFGGENQKYGFEPEVSGPLSTLHRTL